MVRDLWSVVTVSSSFVLKRRSFAELYGDDRAQGQTMPLLCLEGGLRSTALEAHLARPDWVLNLVGGLVRTGGSDWLFAQDHQEERSICADDMPIIRRAAGIDETPDGNLRLTWSIRTYDDRDVAVGGCDWLSDLAAANTRSPSIAIDLVDTLSALVRSAQDAGGSLLIEQISLLISKDGRQATKSLTPSVHADEFYGRRQSAIASLCETGWSDFGATIFYPTLRPHDLGPAGRMAADAFAASFPDATCHVPASGDVIIYDGMVNDHGGKDMQSGIPHVSGDMAGRSSRLIVLMRHEAPI